MNDETRVAIDEAETPVNPYTLLTAVNAASRGANTAWLIFLGLMAYLLVTVAGISHRDLLLNSDVVLPILQVKVDLTRFFLFAPIALVLLHIGLIGQLMLLARKALEFNSALRMLEPTDRRSHPLRLELDSFFFVQVLAGPERSRMVSAFLNGVSWLSLLVLPVMLLLYVQLAFLPFHDATVTLAHRLTVIADVLLLGLIGVFLVRAETSYFGAFLRTGTNNPGSLTLGIVLLVAAAFFSVFVATFPDATERDGHTSTFTATNGLLLGLFPRNLDVSDADLVVDRDTSPGAPSVNLRGRDLRLARLDRVDLHQADMTGANLEGASLVGADLRHVRLQCADGVRMGNRDASRCASARGANFGMARLTEAKMAGVDVRGAQFEDARMEGSDLRQALLAGANLTRAQLERADLAGSSLQGAGLSLANLQGADLSGALLQMADLSSASLQGANLSRATLEGTLLREADLEGANLQMARLFGVNLRGAKLNLADLSGVMIWRAEPPGGDSIPLVDMANVAIKAPSDEDMGRSKSALAALDAGPLKVRLTSLMAPLQDAGPNGAWAGSPEAIAWAGLAKASEAGMADGYRARMTEQLTRLACRSRFASGAVATGVANRAMAAGFKGDIAAVYERLKAQDCAGSSAMPPRILGALAAAADAVRGQ